MRNIYKTCLAQQTRILLLLMITFPQSPYWQNIIVKSFPLLFRVHHHSSYLRECWLIRSLYNCIIVPRVLMPWVNFVHVITSVNDQTAVSKVWLCVCVTLLLTKLLVLLSTVLGAFRTQPCLPLYTSFTTILPLPVLHNPLQLKVYTPANSTFIFHSLDCLLHAFTHATLSTGQALSLLHVCGNPTKPVERHPSKITMNIYSRARLPRFAA